MILASASPVSLGLAAAAALAYAVPALAARALGAAGARRVLLLAWLLHGAQLAWGVLGSEPRFGFAPALSITVWLVLTVYAIHRNDPVFIFGQGLGLIIYFRNLHLHYKGKGRAAAS